MAEDDLAAWAEKERQAYVKGDKGALLRTIQLSLVVFREPIPAWACEVFEAAYDYVMLGGGRSWDEVFGEPHLGKHKRSVALENRRYEVWRRVRELHEDGERLPIGEGLFERVGREMNPGGKPISKTVINDLYYRIDRVVRRLQAGTAEK